MFYVIRVCNKDRNQSLVHNDISVNNKRSIENMRRFMLCH